MLLPNTATQFLTVLNKHRRPAELQPLAITTHHTSSYNNMPHNRDHSPAVLSQLFLMFAAFIFPMPGTRVKLAIACFSGCESISLMSSMLLPNTDTIASAVDGPMPERLVSRALTSPGASGAGSMCAHLGWRSEGVGYVGDRVDLAGVVSASQESAAAAEDAIWLAVMRNTCWQLIE